jgi:hypothetical protein
VSEKNVIERWGITFPQFVFTEEVPFTNSDPAHGRATKHFRCLYCGWSFSFANEKACMVSPELGSNRSHVIDGAIFHADRCHAHEVAVNGQFPTGFAE